MSITEKTEIYTPTYLRLREILGRHERAHWVADEVDLRIDSEQWKNGTLSASDREYIKTILRLFTQADTDVAASYVEKLLPVFGSAEARMMLLSFASREASAHILGYRRLNETLGLDSQEFMSEFLRYKATKEKHDFMIDAADMSTPSGIAGYLAKQVLMEGVNLFGSFAMLLSLSLRGACPGMVSVNQWSVADESLHVEGLCELFRIYIGEHPEVVTDAFKAEIYQVARDVVRLEDAFVDLVYSTGTNSALTADDTKAYVRYVCDYRMQQLGLKPQFGVTANPLPWIDVLLSNTLGNFFETTVVQYSKGSLVGEWVY